MQKAAGLRRIHVRELAAAILLCEAVGMVGSAFVAPAIGTWYASLIKPAFTPPSWLFAPVWTVLYALMGFSAYLVWIYRGKRNLRIMALSAFGVQLALNLLWSILFFGLRSASAGLVGIAMLWIAIAATIYLSARMSKTAAAVMLPYLAWVTFAALLNYYIWLLN